MSRDPKRYVGYCGLFCPSCDWRNGVIRSTAKELTSILERNDELKYIAETTGAFNYEELMKALDWLATNPRCNGGSCRAGDGWTDCPIRKCCKEVGVDFCYECPKFPCETFAKHPLFGERFISIQKEIKELGLEEWIKKQEELF